MYYFEKDNEKSVLRSKVIEVLTGQIASGQFCHKDDIENMLLLFKGDSIRNTEVRIKAEVFSHLIDTVQDNGYYWFFIKSSHVHDNDGKTAKIIGTAREFTAKKLKDFAILESSRRDPVTKLFNHDYGISFTEKAAADALRNNTRFSLSVISISNYDEIEAHYGRVFAASILMMLFTAFPATDENIKTRLSNDEFLVFINNDNKEGATEYANRFFNGVSKLYTGENQDLRLHISIGTVLSGETGGFDELMQCAFQAVRYAEKSSENDLVFYDDIPDNKQEEPAADRNRPINVSFKVVKGDISNYSFELFESTADTHSAINMLITVLGHVYSLREIIICTYDPDFGTGRISHEWNTNGINVKSNRIEKISYNEWVKFEKMLDETGSFLYKGKDTDRYSTTVKRILGVNIGEQKGGYCCVMYESGIPFGRALFHTSENEREWSDEELKELHDITKIIAVNLSNEKSISASRAKSEFLSHISHEIRTPMNAIIGMTSIAKHSMEDTERLADSLEKVDFSAQHLLSLINNMLEMSRIESGKIDIDNSYFSLEKFMHDIDMLMRPSIEEKEIKLDIVTNVSHKIQVLADEFKLRQVIINLISNAGKFTQKDGSIVFTVNELGLDGGLIYLQFSVKDNGPGIAAEDQPGIFKAFEQARSAPTSQKQQGSGLGLAISAGIVSAMGGTILLDSKPGNGCEFYFTLRLEIAPDKSLETDDKELDVFYKNYFSGKNVLIADDIDSSLEVAKFFLEKVGFNVETAINGQEAVDMFFGSGDGYYDAIVMDLKMPVKDGLTATRSIRKNQERPDAQTVPVIAMTAHAFDDELQNSIESGMNGHITKPINVNKLYKVLHAILSDKGESR